ncbi:MAG: RNA-binding protein [Chromatiales bacterium 21-64-14]|nr:MAG: RNA-binding protein [Chromatiales bacterium 21-64-14]HQU14710.1 S4 domain-containing protein [Gammaproteobacteria bacterium]
MSMENNEPAPQDRVRIDKWLWAARFFKTRALAAQAVSGGKVHVNGERVRSSRELHPGNVLSIRRGPYEFVVEVRGLTKRRVPAPEAAQLYEETAESRATRERLAQERRMETPAGEGPSRRPDKRQRRRLFRVIGHGGR